MKYNLYTTRFGHSLYFCEHEGKGFTISSDKERGIVIQGKQEALKEADRLTISTGMNVLIEKINRW